LTDKKTYVAAQKHWHPKCLNCSNCRKSIIGEFTCNVTFTKDDDDDDEKTENYLPLCSVCSVKNPRPKSTQGRIYKIQNRSNNKN
jgi:hypothetical protein